LPFVSIQLNSNRPAQLAWFFDSLESTAAAPEDIEVLLHIDKGDSAMEAAVAHEQQRRRFTLRILQTDLVKSYATLWKPLNPLFKMTHPDVYFVINLSDEILFETKGWDSILRQYVGYYPDHIFRLRASKYRFRNYTDFWECGYAPDSIAFYSRRWLELSGDWNPCLGPDSFQQSVAFYMFTSDRLSSQQFCRDIALPDMHFSGEGAGCGLEGKVKYDRICTNYRAWFVLMSHTMQEEAKRRAMRMKAHMIAHQHGGLEKAKVIEHSRTKQFSIYRSETGKNIKKISYRLSYIRVTLTNLLRIPCMIRYWGGNDEDINFTISSITLMIAAYIPFGVPALTYIGARRLQYKKWRSQAKYLFIYLHHILLQMEDKIDILKEVFAKWYLHVQKRPAILLDKKNHISIRISMGVTAWVMAVSFYSVILTTIELLPMSLRGILAPVRPFARTIKNTVKHRLNAAPELRFLLSYKVVVFKQALLWLVLQPIVLLVESIKWIFWPWKKIRQCADNLFVKYITYHTQKRNKQKRVLDVFDRIKAMAPLKKMAHDDIIFSLHIRNNQPKQIAAILDNIESTAHNSNHIEVILYLHDQVTKTIVERENSQRKIHLYCYITEQAHKQIADSRLLSFTHTNAYFVAHFDEEVRFVTHGWDTRLMYYIGYYSDDIFRLRTSTQRFRNYVNFRECDIAPDSLAFYTRKWLMIQGNLGPYARPHSFQQYISYYIFTSNPFSHTQYYREIAVPHIQLEGNINTDLVEIPLTSQQMQEEAKRRAMILKSSILCAQLIADAAEALIILQDSGTKRIVIQNKNGKVLKELPYRVSRIRTCFSNILFAFYRRFRSSGLTHNIWHQFSAHSPDVPSNLRAA